MAFGVLAGQITVIFLEVLLGYVGARSGIIKDRDSKFLSDFIMRLLLPCTMLAGAAVDGEPELLTQAGVLFVLLLALFVVTTGLCRLSSWLHHDTPGKYAVLVGTAAMPNCGFIGLPLCSALLGTARGTVFAGMAMASYNVWFFTYVVCLFRPGEKIRLKTFITPTNIATVAMLVLLATGWLGVIVPKGFLPSEDMGFVVATTEAEQGISFEGMVKAQHKLDEVLRNNPHVDRFNSVVGIVGSSQSMSNGTLMIHLKPHGERPLRAYLAGRRI